GAGVVLFRQTAAGSDSFHVSASMATVFGWDTAAFLSPGILRSMVHPDDAATFVEALAPGGSDEYDTVIDLTATGSPGPRRSHGPSSLSAAASEELADPVVRFRS